MTAIQVVLKMIYSIIVNVASPFFMVIEKVKAVVPNSFFADPDPVVFLNADPDPAVFLNADPDPAAFSLRIRILL